MIDLTDIYAIFPNGLDIYVALDLLGPVGTYVIGMAVYALFVFQFYRFVAARDMFALDLSRYQESRHRWVRGFLHVVLYVAKYILLFPALAFFWFAVFTLILAILSKDRAFSDILLIIPGHRQRHPGDCILQRGPVPGPGQDPALRGPGHLPDRCVLLQDRRFPEGAGAGR